MLIDIRAEKEENISITGGQRHVLDERGSYLVRFPSPNHPKSAFSVEGSFGTDIRKYLDRYHSDSFLVVDKAARHVRIGRDWPGNVQMYYWRSPARQPRRLLVSDDLNEIVRALPERKPSPQGVRLFFQDRKHFHLHTIHEGVEILLPGSYMEFDLRNGGFNIRYWFEFRKPIQRGPLDETHFYRTELDSALENLVDRNSPVALMYSGGSDSTLLLERLLKLGYTNFSLFNIKIAGQETENERAKQNADALGMTLHTIEAQPDEVLNDWFENIKTSYMCSSDVRIDGMFCVDPSVYRALNQHYSGAPVSVLWGLQHTYTHWALYPREFLKGYGSYFLSRVLRVGKNGRLNRLGKMLVRSTDAGSAIDSRKMPPEQLSANEDQLLSFFDQVTNPVEVLNLSMIFGSGRKKEWTMERQRICAKYYPNASNVFPFYYRPFQEGLFSLSLKARYGRLARIFLKSSTYKHLVLNSLEGKVSSVRVLGGTKAALPAWWTLFRRKDAYERFTSILQNAKNESLLKFVREQGLVHVPASFEEYMRFDTTEVEKLAGVAMIASNFEESGVSFP